MRCLYLLLTLSGSCLAAADGGWTAYGHDLGGTRYSPLKQIDAHNVSKLKVAWTYHTGALAPATDLNNKAAFEATPILIEGVLYLTTPFNRVIALDPATGAEKWTYDPEVSRAVDYSEVSSRGVAAWIESKPLSSRAVCRVRLFEGTLDARLLAIDARTGKLCQDFGTAGTVDLKSDVGYRECCGYEVTSAPVVVGDLVITGSSIADNGAVAMERGVVRAYDVRTGKLRWTWDPIPWSNKQKTRTGAANAWSTLSADPAHDLVFVPTGSASPDYYGGERPGDNAHANSVVALKASTGALVWSFQVVHHDLWDYDVASQPALIRFGGKDAVAVTTKMGNVFVLDRLTGKPLMQVDERPVPKSDIPGEMASATQPFPAWSPMVPQSLTADTVWGPTPEAQAWCRERIRRLRNEGMFTPPSLQGTLVVPGNVGGVNWGSASWDPERQLLFAITDRLPAMVKLIPRAEMDSMLADREKNRMTGEFAPQRGTPYGMYREFLISPAGAPCSAPPWAALVAFDLRTGKLRWESAVGKTISLGGPISTGGGLAFAGASLEPFLRAYNTDTGEEVWKAELPASAQSTPMTYEWQGKQYVVVCAGGHGKAKDFGSKMGDSVVAFRLP
ncbi:MAG TPA: pyrroloquinoline quinone-dependent dehydrogenase [Candidatus Sulfopaludibacter sp.]|jgi:quinoprotein glucose dehydrogenase|nr:pyrroloquinoline quinone-dependent dehydrogenase [Candidatus Sulfopaludibacter sp.]